MKNKLIISTLTVLTVVIQAISLCGCIPNTKTFCSTQNGMYFDTVVSVSVYDKDYSKAEEASKYSLNLCEKYEKLFSNNLPESDIYKINNSKGRMIDVSAETIQLLERSIYYSEISDGEFDISIAPLTDLWDFHGDDNTIPSSATINNSLKHIDYRHLILDSTNNRACLDDELSEIEIGGIAKGYIADKIAEYLSSLGISGALINMGGDIKTIGTNQNGTAFSIGINDPDNSGTPLFPIYLKDYSVATSGTYERFFTSSDGNLYHHILDSKTGYPSITDISQASVVTKESVDADALATICIIKGSQKALEFIENLDNTEVILITNSGEIIKSSGISKYINNSQ